MFQSGITKYKEIKNMAQEKTVAQTVPPRQTSRFFGIKIIKTGFQLKFAIIVFGFMAVATFFMWFQGHMAVERIIQSGMVTGQDAIMNLQLMNDIVAKTGYIALAIVFGLSIYFSFTIAGPIYRFEKTLETMREGDLNARVKLRPVDEFKDVADLFTQTLASLRLKVKKERDGIEEKLQKAEKLAAKLKSAGHTAEATELEQIVFEVRNAPPQIKI